VPDKLPVVSGKETIKVLVKLGFEVRRGKGDHVVLKKGFRVFVVPLHNPLKKGTLRKILKQAGISVEEFNTML
jgi:predicted RNA binding protein YcfA (HicA-like mRNA interferase family)